METIMETVLAEGSAEFSRRGETYRIQEESNKGCHYLSLWRLTPRAVCLSRVCFEVFDGASEEILEELWDQPLPDGRTVRDLIAAEDRPASRRDGERGRCPEPDGLTEEKRSL